MITGIIWSWSAWSASPFDFASFRPSSVPPEGDNVRERFTPSHRVSRQRSTQLPFLFNCTFIIIIFVLEIESPSNTINFKSGIFFLSYASNRGCDLWQWGWEGFVKLFETVSFVAKSPRFARNICTFLNKSGAHWRMRKRQRWRWTRLFVGWTWRESVAASFEYIGWVPILSFFFF